VLNNIYFKRGIIQVFGQVLFLSFLLISLIDK